MATDNQTGVVTTDPANKPGDGAGNGAADQKEVEGLKAALEAARKRAGTLESKLARLEGTVDGLKSGQQSKTDTAPRIYTRAELRAMVEKNQITEDQMDSVLEQQLENKLRAEMAAKTTQVTTAARIAADISAQLERYVEQYPDLKDEGSDLRAKVQAEFDYLHKLGDDPNNPATELKAVKMALGNLAPKGRKKSPETHQETNGANLDDDDASTTNDQFKGLSATQKAHYEKLIRNGMYKGASGEKALKAELDGIRARQKLH